MDVLKTWDFVQSKSRFYCCLMTLSSAFIWWIWLDCYFLNDPWGGDSLAVLMVILCAGIYLAFHSSVGKDLADVLFMIAVSADAFMILSANCQRIGLKVTEGFLYSWFRSSFAVISLVTLPTRPALCLSFLSVAVWVYLLLQEYSMFDPRVLGYIVDSTFTNLGVYYVVYFSERTCDQLIKARHIAEDANHAKSLFMARMSHDLRTPLNGILGFLNEMLLTPLNEAQTEMLSIIKLCAETLERLTMDLLDVNLMEMGQVRLVNEEFDIQESIRSLEILSKSLGKSRAIKFHFDGIPKIVKGDASRLKQIIINLISNAIKFTPLDGSISVTLEVDPDRSDDKVVTFRFSVRDTGIGIPKEMVDRICDPFFQCRSDDGTKGCGLGLFIVHQLLQLMKGEIHCKSTLYEGTEFYGNFQLERCHDQQASTQVENFQNFENLSVLIAEDNPINMKLMLRFCGKLGIKKILQAENGKQAVDQYIQHKGELDVILMDMQMPVLNGLDATKTIRALEDGTNHIPIVAVTAGLMPHEMEEMKSAGVSNITPKPVTMKGLSHALQTSRPT